MIFKHKSSFQYFLLVVGCKMVKIRINLQVCKKNLFRHRFMYGVKTKIQKLIMSVYGALLASPLNQVKVTVLCLDSLGATYPYILAGDPSLTLLPYRSMAVNHELQYRAATHANCCSWRSKFSVVFLIF